MSENALDYNAQNKYDTHKGECSHCIKVKEIVSRIWAVCQCARVSLAGPGKDETRSMCARGGIMYGRIARWSNK